VKDNACPKAYIFYVLAYLVHFNSRISFPSYWLNGQSDQKNSITLFYKTFYFAYYDLVSASNSQVFDGENSF